MKFRNEAASDAALRAVGANQLRTIEGIGVHIVTVPSERAAAVLSTLSSNSSVAWAERDAVLKPQELLPNDPFFPQGNYTLIGGAWGWTRTHTTQAWDITQGDPSIVIAILDTGLKNLPDFAGQTVQGWNVMNGSPDTSTNAGNHGTHVAGAAGLALGNGIGNAGYCPRCKIMPVQVGTDSWASYSDMASGITWAADHGARVENLSWAGTSSSSALASAVSYARSRGVVVVAAAGNSNCDCPTYPAATPGVIGVAGTDSSDQKQSDSNFGNWVALAAPESNMTTLMINGAPGYSPFAGTSLAAPVVAGIAGLLFSYDPSLSGTQVEQALESTAVPVGFTVKSGRVDALAALGSLGATDPQTPSAPMNVSLPQILVSTNSDFDTAPVTAAPQPGQVLVRGQGAWLGSAPLSLSAVQWQHCDLAGASCTTVGTSAKYTVQSSDSGYVLRVVVTVKNGLGSTTVASPITLAVGGATSSPPPANTSLPTISGTPQESGTLTASTGTWSGSPTSYAYQWQRCDLNGAACAPVAGGITSSYAVTSADVGDTLRVVVTATNATGSASATSAPSGVVSPAPASGPTTQTLTFSGSLNAKNPTRTFSLNVGAGAADARLSFSKCSALSLAVQSAAGTSVAAKSGPSVVVLDTTLVAGAYSYSVTGGRCSFTLTITSASP